MTDPSTERPHDRVRIAAFGTALLVAAVVWGVARSLGDLWIALAAGRDILAGRLGAPDDWSFVTQGRVWLNQNWGAHAATWLAFAAGGESGLLLLKALLIGAALTFGTLLARIRGAGVTAALLAASGLLLAGYSYIDLRPNLATIVLAPLTLALVHRAVSGSAASAARVLRRAALAGAVVVLWANVHAGFLLGLLMLWLRAAVEAVRPAGASPGAGRGAAPVLAAVAAVTTLLCGIASPFGFRNLTETFRIVGATGWHEVREWQPIWAANSYDAPWGFGVAVAVLLLVGLAAGRNAPSPPNRGKARPVAGTGLDGARLFDIVLVVVTIALAVRARRFVPVALVAMIPLVAVGLDRATRRFGSWVPVAALALQLGGVALLLPSLLHTYDRANPRLPPGDSIFARMHSLNSDFPVTATRFIERNRIGGDAPAGIRALVAWEWEGYCRLRAPHLKVMMGGRAQQIYTPGDLDQWRRTIGADIASETRARGIPLALLHAAPEAHRDQIAALLEAGWVTLFMDPPVVLLVDPRDAGMASLLARAEAGELEYPDESTRLAATAWLRLAALPSGRSTAAEARGAVEAALTALPDPTWCHLLASLGGGSPEAAADAIRALDACVRRLEAVEPGRAPFGERLLLTRRAARGALANLHERAGRPEAAASHRAAADFDSGLLSRLRARWRM